MDVFTDPDPVTYREWVKFTLPDNAGGRTAIAVSSTTAGRITALYTIFIIWIFIVAWHIAISIVLLVFTPPIMTRTSYIAVVAAWNANDPFQATLLMLRHTGHILKGMCRRQYKAEFNCRNLLLDIAILVVASGTFAGSITAGYLFPDRLTIGSSAPVNPNLMHYPDLLRPQNGTKGPEFLKLNYASMGALRAFGAIEASEVTILQNINLQQHQDQSWTENGREAQRYRIDYGYNVTGAQMGLQMFGKLTVHVQGTCSFADDWWVNQLTDNSGKKYDNYTLWKDNQPAADGNKAIPAVAEIDPSTAPLAYFARSGKLANATKIYYSILPVVAGKSSITESFDPWYETIPHQMNDFSYQVASKRPPLKCYQTDEWSYNGWKGSTSELLYGDQAPVKFPEAIKIILGTEFSVPMIVNIGMALQAGALKSSTRILPGRQTGIDAQSSSAIKDMKRIVLAAYLATRNIFRDAAMAGLELGKERSNVLERADGKMLDGVGDVVIVSSVVSSLRFGYFVAIPAILASLLFVTGLFKIGKKAFGIYDGKFNPGTYSRFLQFLMGLHATQLYRMVDQILAQVEIQDDDTQTSGSPEEHIRHQKQAHWFGQISALPRIAAVEDPQNKVKFEDLVLPQLRAVTVRNSNQHRLTLRASDGINSIEKCEWRKLDSQEIATAQPGSGGENKNLQAQSSPV